ncbi:MAG TPA: histidinol dehydrogenase [Synergistetes bacterium]|nr:histidinol dehydrogenase [Synergistota bacterium]
MFFLKEPEAGSTTAIPDVSETVSGIIAEVLSRGTEAVKRYSAFLDGYSGPVRVASHFLDEAERSLTPDLKKALSIASSNIRSFHSLQKELLEEKEWTPKEGLTLGLRFAPVESAAIYIPGGRYPLPSTALMGVIAAQEAGVKRIAAFTPPSTPTGPDPVILGTLSMLGINETWAVGGAQAVAAAALGTEDISPVDIIAGPGNIYVTEAKRQLFGKVGIDGLAGPSEVLVIADDTADPDLLAADLLAQAEHDTLARSTLLCTELTIAERTLSIIEQMLGDSSDTGTALISWTSQGSIAVCSLEDAVKQANIAAPEHIVLAVRDPRTILSRCTSFGSAFLGNLSAQSFGDYSAGTNHILPTGRSARFSGGLWTGSFMRLQTFAEIGPSGTSELAKTGGALAEAEGLDFHRVALLARTSRIYK